MRVQLLAAVAVTLLLAVLSLRRCLLELLTSPLTAGCSRPASHDGAVPPLSCSLKAGLCWVPREEVPI